VVSFWASWCGPCRMELPALAKFYERHRAEAEHFEVLAISSDEDPEDAQKFVTKARLPFPILMDSTTVVSEKYGARVIPMMFVIDENGKVISGHTGFISMMDYQLVKDLGLKPITPMEGAKNDSSSH
jgi:thiol-disulfide isomerase/thioredoxin